MPRYVAFLRGINVGGHVVRMEQLREIVAGLGYDDVETFIASGNVIFSTRSTDGAACEKKISTALAKALGYAVAVFVRSMDEVHAIAAHEPFPALDGGDKLTTYIIMLADAPPAPLGAKITGLASEVDEVAVNGREIHWRVRGSMLDSPFTKRQPRELAAGTMRNRNTLARLAAKYPLGETAGLKTGRHKKKGRTQDM